MANFTVKTGLLSAAILVLNVGIPQQAQAGLSDEVIQLVNQARSQGRVCGNQRFGAARSLSANGSLTCAAQVHSSDMARNRTMSHTGSNGSSVGDRIRQAGYKWRTYGENVAAGQKSTREGVVVQLLLNNQVSQDENGTSILAYLKEFGGFITPFD
ncbi:CAP domain-containing protein [Nodularia sp. LEGE 04288]|uniref:CAP domain-containing protein n=1 Tax=Nodularia sp. LEGE 04288 TaxID=1828639 RepID=UPI001D10FE67|nr:CAP domain-containing protein [Nodularia sp. LEGE 04288]MCC2691634.1 CAP domain-containing protein [Nodularia sp. LEGE 04288]